MKNISLSFSISDWTSSRTAPSMVFIKRVADLSPAFQGCSGCIGHWPRLRTSLQTAIYSGDHSICVMTICYGCHSFLSKKSFNFVFFIGSKEIRLITVLHRHIFCPHFCRWILVQTQHTNELLIATWLWTIDSIQLSDMVSRIQRFLFSYFLISRETEESVVFTVLDHN